MTKITNWGQYPIIDADVYSFTETEKLQNMLEKLESLIPRGMGRCYGDSALSSSIISTLRFNNLLSFDDESGVISCQSGVTFSDIFSVFVPRGWFFPVTPGTKFVTVGGAIASDVHGKNHHKEGNFSNHVISLKLMLAGGTIVDCSRKKNSDLFFATCGGMGLTGIILSATFRLVKIETAYIRQESIKAQNLSEVMDLFEQSNEWAYSVAWIDCMSQGDKLGRSIMMRGEHASYEDAGKSCGLDIKDKKKLTVPFNLPGFVLNELSVKTFNMLFFNRQKERVNKSLIDCDSFFYPLDNINNWNRIYGNKGFVQYQLVLPRKESRVGMTKILSKISAKGMGSFLAILKLLGTQDGFLPFSMEGYTLALDFPVKKGLFEFLDELDKIVLDFGGRLYLAKDSRMSEEMFIKSYSELKVFRKNMLDVNKNFKFKSLQSERIGLTK